MSQGAIMHPLVDELDAEQNAALGAWLATLTDDQQTVIRALVRAVGQASTPARANAIRLLTDPEHPTRRELLIAPEAVQPGLVRLLSRPNFAELLDAVGDDDLGRISLCRVLTADDWGSAPTAADEVCAWLVDGRQAGWLFEVVAELDDSDDIRGFVRVLEHHGYSDLADLVSSRPDIPVGLFSLAGSKELAGNSVAAQNFDRMLSDRKWTTALADFTEHVEVSYPDAFQGASRILAYSAFQQLVAEISARPEATRRGLLLLGGASLLSANPRANERFDAMLSNGPLRESLMTIAHEIDGPERIKAMVRAIARDDYVDIITAIAGAGPAIAGTLYVAGSQALIADPDAEAAFYGLLLDPDHRTELFTVAGDVFREDAVAGLTRMLRHPRHRDLIGVQARIQDESPRSRHAFLPVMARAEFANDPAAEGALFAAMLDPALRPALSSVLAGVNSPEHYASVAALLSRRANSGVVLQSVAGSGRGTIRAVFDLTGSAELTGDSRAQNLLFDLVASTDVSEGILSTADQLTTPEHVLGLVNLLNSDRHHELLHVLQPSDTPQLLATFGLAGKRDAAAVSRALETLAGAEPPLRSQAVQWLASVTPPEACNALCGVGALPDEGDRSQVLFALGLAAEIHSMRHRIDSTPVTLATSLQRRTAQLLLRQADQPAYDFLSVLTGHRPPGSPLPDLAKELITRSGPLGNVAVENVLVTNGLADRIGELRQRLAVTSNAITPPPQAHTRQMDPAASPPNMTRDNPQIE